MNRSSNFIEGRRLKLEKYLKGLQRVAGLQHSNDYMSFLGADQEQAAGAGGMTAFDWTYRTGGLKGGGGGGGGFASPQGNLVG